MNLRRSISHPELMVSENGDVYRVDSGHRVNIIKDHGTTMRGPLVAYRDGDRIKQVSVIRLVFEAHVKKEKLEPNDYVETVDGDDYNVKADNLTYGSRYRTPKKKKKNTENKPKESYYCWMNGNDEVFV